MVGNILPVIIQGGMGAGVSNWRLAQAVSRIGQLGVVSGTGLDQIFARRLQDGDPGGHMRRALQALPLKGLAQSILDAFYIPGGKKPDAPYLTSVMHTVEGQHGPQSLCIAANFAEVFLAREGHTNPVGINYLEKIQLPHLPSLYGAMLAGVAVVIVGAGIPFAVPAAIDALAVHQPATYPINVGGVQTGEDTRMVIDPKQFWDKDMSLGALPKPYFLPIVASETLASILSRRVTPGGISGFVVEGPLAGGHNAPPRGKMVLGDDGQPIYGARDKVNLAAMRELGLPFWLAGCYGAPDRLKEALAEGAAGIQVGTAFALCVESGVVPEVRRALVSKALAGQAKVFTDPKASPTGFPFKVAQLEGSLSEEAVYRARRRICDLGFLREPYRREDGKIGYRCPAEPEAAYVAKGGKVSETEGRKCLCNALVANIGMPQIFRDGTREQCLITLGDDFAGVGRFCAGGNPDYTAADVVRTLLG